MKIVIEVNSSDDFDYEYFIDWLNDEVSNSITYTGVDISADILSVDGKKV